MFARLNRIALAAYDRIVGLILDDLAVDGCITKAPGGGELDELGPPPDDITVHLDAGYDSGKTR
nr:hypothetical protein GCM10010200_076300 [Actinomadura rugatobispora]